jgi:hypothetical protein
MKEQIPTTKQQHWVPRFYLKGWANKKDQLCCFDKINQGSFSTNYKNVAGSTWFNDLFETRDADKPELYQAVEKLLSDIEGQCAPLVEALRIMAKQLVHAWPGEPANLTQPITEKQRHLLSGFVALQHLRTEQFRREAADSYTKYHQLALEKTLPIYSPELDPANWTVTIDENEIKKLHIEMLLDFQSYIPYFYEKFWVYGINVTGKPLITSDNPVVLFPTPIHPAIPFDGIASFGMRIIFPISPLISITMYDPEMYPNQRQHHCQLGFYTEQTVDDYNELQLRQCRRQIFSTSDHFDFARSLCFAEPRICQPDDCRFPVHGPVIDQMLTGLVQIAEQQKARLDDGEQPE